jgi:hypothetical protein
VKLLLILVIYPYSLLASMLAFAVAATPTALFAQDECGELLRHGIYNRIRTINTASNASEASSQLCSAYNEMHKHSSSSSGSISAIGYGSGSVSFTRDQLDAIGSYMCTESSSGGTGSKNEEIVRETIDQTLVETYGRCKSQYADGLKVRTTFNENSQSNIVIELHYSPPAAGRPSVKFNSFKIDQTDKDSSRQVTCEGSLVRAASKGRRLNSKVLSLSCSRPIVANPSQAFFVNGEKVLAAPVTITIGTTAGAVTRTLEAVLPGPPLVPDLPVGSVVPMYLSPKELTDLAPKWLPADGKTVADSNSPLYGHELPNLENRMVYGAPITRNITASVLADGGLQAGSLKASLAGLHGQTDSVRNETLTDKRGNQTTNSAPDYVIDTMTDESSSANHFHTFGFVGDAQATTDWPPFRMLVYMVKCR